MLKTWTNKFDYKKTFQKPFTAKKSASAQSKKAQSHIDQLLNQKYA